MIFLADNSKILIESFKNSDRILVQKAVPLYFHFFILTFMWIKNWLEFLFPVNLIIKIGNFLNWPSYEISSLCNTTMKCKYCNLVYVFVVVTIQKNDKIAILSLQVQFWYLCIWISHFTNTLWVKCTFTKLPINILKGRI